MKKRILLSSKFGNNIFTRNVISLFFDKINSLKEQEIVLDFKDIDFISRSCADEYLKRRMKSDKEVVEENLSDDVRQMFKLVQKQYEKANFEVSNIKKLLRNSPLLAA